MKRKFSSEKICRIDIELIENKKIFHKKGYLFVSFKLGYTYFLINDKKENKQRMYFSLIGFGL